MSKARPRREFRRTSFACTRDWVHFCVEFDLKLCRGCRRRSRIGIGAPREWTCRECAEREAAPDPLPLHPDLWRALVDGEETETACPVCHTVVPLRSCWISEDARRLYCASHLKPIETADRLESARAFLERAERSRTVAGVRPGLGRGASLLTEHLATDRCRSCSHNGAAVYAGGRLVEVDRDRRRCTSAPDALNCADVDH